MEKRVLFAKGKQRAFLKKVLLQSNCVSLRRLTEFGFVIPYGTLKNYYTEQRLMSKELVENLSYFGKISDADFSVIYLKKHWGQVKGGKKSRRGRIKEEKSERKYSISAQTFAPPPSAHHPPEAVLFYRRYM
ncbi:MAG: hypothetical protein AABX16_05300 [Nanoarchaeota archaeon]